MILILTSFHSGFTGGCNEVGPSGLLFGVPLSWLLMEDYYTTGEAARILKVTEARVRQMLGAGELEGTRDPVSDRSRIP